MKEKYKQAAQLLSQVITWGDVISTNKTFTKELINYSVVKGDTITVLNNVKGLKDADGLILLYLKDIVSIPKEFYNDFELVTRATLPTTHTFVIKKRYLEPI
tara:strand:- start:479 stop:784 length:306 start_codon:yes stop_codon:yes gene_type:complete